MSNKSSISSGFSNAFIASITSEVINIGVDATTIKPWSPSSHSFTVRPAPLNANWFRNERLGLNLWSFNFNVSADWLFTSSYSVVNVINVAFDGK